MKRIRLTVQLPRIKSRNTAQEIAESMADHLFDTFNDNNSIEEITFRVLTDTPKKEIPQSYVNEIVEELTEWAYECEQIAGDATTEEEAASYTERATKIRLLVKEVMAC